MLRKIQHGVGNYVVLDFPENATFAQILGDARTKTALAYGENVECSVQGVNQASNCVAPGGTNPDALPVISVHNKACTKAHPIPCPWCGLGS